MSELMPKFDRWVDEFVWGPDSKAVYLASGDAGERRFCVSSLRASRRLRSSRLRRTASSPIFNLSADGKNLVATRMSVDQPAEINVLRRIDRRGAGGRGLAERGEAGSDIAKFSILRTLDVEDRVSEAADALERCVAEHARSTGDGTFWFLGAGGTPVQGFIVRPPNFDETRKYPVKFLIHGGPQGAWGDAWSYRWNPELMAASGYVVVMVNPRGSTGYGQAFIDGVNGDWGGKAYVDLMKGLDYAEKQYPLSTRRGSVRWARVMAGLWRTGF